MSAEQFIEAYGYWALAVGAILEGETILIIAGYLAHRGYLELPGVMAVAALGSFAGDQFYFWMGRLHGEKLLARRPKWRAKVDRVHRLLNTNPTLFLAGFRFLAGMRVLGAVVIGMTSINSLRFVGLNACGAVLWALVYTTAGYLFGSILQQWIEEIRQHEFKILGIVVLIGLTVWLIQWKRNKAHA